MMKTGPELLAQRLKDAGKIALCCHFNPDGDTLGSALALRLALLKLGKQVDVFERDKVPDNMTILPGHESVRTPESIREDERWDLLVPVDCSTDDRTSGWERLKERGAYSFQADHHGTNPCFCEGNWVEEGPATALLIRKLMKQLDITPDREMAICLYVGLSTDTGNFSFDNVTPEVFQVMEELMEQDLPLATLSTVLFRERPLAQAKLIGRALNSLETICDGRATVMMLTLKDFESCGALEEHADTVVNQGLDLVGVKMAALLRETPEGNVKVSLRARDDIRVDDLAREFGGGGHSRAAGIKMQHVSLTEAREKLTAAMESHLLKQMALA